MKMLPWLIQHRTALHDVLSFLPYPEVAVKLVPVDNLMHWKELKAYHVQVSVHQNVIMEEDATEATKEFCRTWLAACSTNNGAQRDRMIVRDPKRWKRLERMYADAPSCSCPPGVSEESWNVLHILRYVLWVRPATAWGRMPNTLFGSLYHALPAVQQLCEKVATRSAWGDSVSLPSGLTWED